MKGFINFLERNRSGMMKVLLVVVGMVWGAGAWGQIAVRGKETANTTSGASSITINKPAGVIEGDVMLAIISGKHNRLTGSVNDFSSSGWTLISSYKDNYNKTCLFYKVATSSEGSNYTFSFGATAQHYASSLYAGSVISFSGVASDGLGVAGSGAGPFANTTGTFTNSNSGITSITTNSNDAAVILFTGIAEDCGTLSSQTTSTAGSLSEEIDFSPNDDCQVGIAWLTKSTAGSTGSASLTLTGGGTYTYPTNIMISLKKLESSISTSGTLTAFSSCPSTASTSQSFTVSGSNLTADISITAPTGFEVSTDNSNWFSSRTLSQSSGTVASTTIYARMASGASSPASGNITCTSTGATTQNIAVSGTIANTATTNPSNGNICVNGSYSAAVTASGGTGSYTYQWYSNTSNSNTGGSIINGATSSSYSPSTSVAGTYYYYCVVSSCSQTATSNAATLNINALPAISTQPSAATICVGGTFSPSLSATGGTSLTYQWQYSSNNSTFNNVANGTPSNSTYSNATTNNLSVTGSIATGSSYYYRCVISDAGSGCSSVTSSSVQLTINAVPTISTHPTAATICVGGTYSPSVTPSGGATLSYQWQFSANNSTWGNVINGTPTNSTYSNSTTATLSASGSVAAGNAYYYRCIVSSTGSGCSSVTSNAAQLTINAVPSISTHPSATTVCVGGGYSPTVTATGGVTLSYQWQFSTDNSTFNNVANSTPTNATYTNPTTATLSLSGSVAAGSNYYYRCVVSSTGNGCSSVNSNSAQLTINAIPTITSQPSASTICFGGTFSPSVTVTGGVTLSYQWQYNTTGSTYASVANGTPANSSYSNATTNNLTVSGNIAAGTYNYRCAISSTGTGCTSINSSVAALTIVATPTTSNAGPDQTICFTSTATLAANAPSAGTGQWSIVSGPNTNTSQFSSTSANNATFTPAGGAGTYVLRWTISNSPCSASTDDVSIIVSPANTRYYRVNNGWASTSSWSETSGGATGASVPTCGDNVVIELTGTYNITGVVTTRLGTFTVNSSCNPTIKSSSGTATLTLSGTNALKINSSAYLQLFADNGPTSVNMTFLTGSTLTIDGTLELVKGSNTNYSNIDITNAVATVTNGGTLKTFWGGTSNITGSSTSTLNINNGGTFELNGNGGSIPTATWGATSTCYLPMQNLSTGFGQTFGHMTIDRSGYKATTDANCTIAGNLTVASGTFEIGSNFAISVAGTTSVSGTFTLAGTGTKTFSDNVTINSGGTWNETGVATINFGGNLTNNGTFTTSSNTGTHDFNSSDAQSLNGTIGTIAKVTFSGGGTKTLNSPVTVSTTLTLTSGIVVTTTTNLLDLTATTAGSLVATGSNTNMIDGPLKRGISTTGTYVFPVGDNGKYYPFEISSITGTSPGGVRIQAFDANPGGTSSTYSLSSTEYWEAVWGTNTTGAIVKLERPSGNSILYVGTSTTTANGSYSSLGGTVSGQAVTATNSVGTVSSATRYYAMIQCAGLNGTYTVGSGGNYATIGAAITDLHNCGVSGPVIFSLTDANYSTSGEIINQISGASSTNTITFRPASGVTTTISGSSTTEIFRLNGTDYVIFDGRSGGLGTSNNLSITNTSTATGGSAFTLINDATYNTIKYCNLKSSFTSASSGVIIFSTTTSSSGNDNNTVDYCVIDGNTTTASPTSGVAANGILSNGTSLKSNDNNTISNNEFKNIWVEATPDPTFIYLNTNNSTWSITGNSFYQTGTRTATAARVFYGIRIGDGDGYTISGNFFGGAAASAASGTWTQNSSGSNYTIFYGIHLTVGTTNVSSVQNNTFKSMTWDIKGSNPWAAIYVVSGNVNIGTATGNTIGASSGTSSLQFINTTGTPNIYGIYSESTGTISIRNNNISSISTCNCANSFNFYGIRTSGTNGIYSIQSNNIGSATSGAITLGGASTGSSNQNFYGIYNSATGQATINSNVINNILVYGTDSPNIYAIRNDASGSSSTINSNTITNLKTNDSGTSYSSYVSAIRNASSNSITIQNNIINTLTVNNSLFIGLWDLGNATTNAVTISNNTIGSTSADNITISTYANLDAHYGIYLAGSTGNNVTVSGNTIQNITSSASTGASGLTLSGLTVAAGSKTITENTISYIKNSNTAADKYLVNGIELLGGGTVTVTKNKILNLINRASRDATLSEPTLYMGAQDIRGIYLSGPTAHIHNNLIKITNTLNDGTVSTNAISISGIRTNSGTLNLFHNTVVIGGQESATNSDRSYTACYRHSASCPTLSVQNNIFINNRTTTNNRHFAIYSMDASCSGTAFDQNYLEVENSTYTAAFNSSTNYNITTWNALAFVGTDTDGSANNVTIGDDGSIDATEASYVGTGSNLTATVPTDIVNTNRATTPTKGCYESAIATITLASNTVSVSDNCASSTKVPIQSFSLAVTNGTGNLTNVGFTTTGTYVQADVTKYQLWYHTSNDITGAAQLGTDLSSSGGQGARTFASFSSPTLSNNATYYFWITVDVASGTTNNATIAVNAITNTDLTSSSYKAGGPSSSGGTQTLKSSPSISSHPSAATICYGGTYSPSVTASGGVTLSYQWQFSTDGTSGWANVANNTPTNATFTNNTTATLTQTGNIAQGSAYYYRCVVSSTGNGCSSVNSNAAQLTINAVPTIGTQPTSITECVGGTDALSVSASGGTPSLTYQWYSNTTSSNSGGSSIGSATSSSYTVPSTSAGTTYYYVQVSASGSGCTTATSNAVAAVITAAPNAGTLSGTQAICSNGTTTFSSDGGSGSWTSGSTGVATINSSTGAITPVSAGTSTITYTVTGTGGCSNATATRTVTVTALPTASISYAGTPFTTSQGAGQAVTLTGTSSGTYSSTIGLTIDGSTGSLTPSSSTVGTYTVTYTIAASGGCAQVTATTSITINSGATTFYYDGTGSMATLTNWGTNTDGSGTNPLSMIGNNLTFYIVNNNTTTPSNDAAWPLGTGSKIIVGDGTNVTNFTITSGNTISGTIDVANNGTLTITATTPPTLGLLNSGSTIVYNGGAGQTIASGTAFGNLSIDNSSGVSLGGNASVSGTLALTSGTLTVGANTLTLSGSSISRTSGNIDASNGSALVSFTNSSALTLPASCFSGNVNRMTLNGAGGVILGSNTTVSSTLTLTSGTLTVGANTLTLANNLAPVRTSGNIDLSNASAEIEFTNTSGITLPASLFSGNISKWKMNGTGGITLNGNTTITKTLTLSSGKLIIPTSTTLLLGSTSADIDDLTGSTSSYIVTTNNTSSIRRYINSKNNQLYSFPMGDATYYSPMTFTLKNTTSSISNAYLTTYVVDGYVPGFNESQYTTKISRYWSVEPSGMTLPNYDISYTYDNSDLIGTETSLLPIKKSGTTWYKPTNAVNITTGTNEGVGSVNDGTNTLTWTGLSTFSFDTGTGDEAQPLPIHLLYFTAKTQLNRVRLDWATASETNNDYFTVERSQDGEHFNELFKKPGAGISTTNLYYFGYDNKPFYGISYYRLKQTDYDGKYEYSGVESVNFTQGNAKEDIELNIYPNPVENGTIHIKFDAKQTAGFHISLYDAVGKLIYQETINSEKGPNDHAIELPSVAAGMYQLEIRNDELGVVTRSIEF